MRHRRCGLTVTNITVPHANVSCAPVCLVCGQLDWTLAAPKEQAKAAAGNIVLRCKSCARKRAALRRAKFGTFEKSRVNEASKRWARENPAKATAKVMLRHAAKLQRMPIWSDKQAIKAFYEACPSGMTVDHIIPLQGVQVSGLHVASNLQYLTPTANYSKGNSYVVI